MVRGGWTRKVVGPKQGEILERDYRGRRQGAREVNEVDFHGYFFSVSVIVGVVLGVGIRVGVSISALEDYGCHHQGTREADAISVLGGVLALVLALA